jgi:hypothetical protein
MKPLFAIILLYFSCSLFTYSQDTIVRKNGLIVPCKIQRADSSNVYFIIKKNGENIDTYLDKNEIETFRYGKVLEQTFSQFDKTSFGIGLGMDYGGIGINALFYPQKNIGFFGGIGYAIAGVGFNAGLKWRLVTAEHTSSWFPYLLGMYGYNAAIAVTNASEYNKIFYGPTFGFGLDYHNPRNSGYWTFSLLIPIRGSEVDDYISSHNITLKSSLSPIGLSVGYRFIID